MSIPIMAMVAAPHVVSPPAGVGHYPISLSPILHHHYPLLFIIADYEASLIMLLCSLLAVNQYP